MRDYVEGEPIGYVVVTWNQASHWPGIDYAHLHDTATDARDDAARMTAETRKVGRGERHTAAAVIELPEEPSHA